MIGRRTEAERAFTGGEAYSFSTSPTIAICSSSSCFCPSPQNGGAFCGGPSQDISSADGSEFHLRQGFGCAKTLDFISNRSRGRFLTEGVIPFPRHRRWQYAARRAASVRPHKMAGHFVGAPRRIYHPQPEVNSVCGKVLAAPKRLISYRTEAGGDF